MAIAAKGVGGLGDLSARDSGCGARRQCFNSPIRRPCRIFTVVGSLLIIAEPFTFYTPRVYEEWVNVVFEIWLIVSPWVVDIPPALAWTKAVVVGVLLLAIALMKNGKIGPRIPTEGEMQSKRGCRETCSWYPRWIMTRFTLMLSSDFCPASALPMRRKGESA